MVLKWLRALRIAAGCVLGLGVLMAAAVELIVPDDYVALWEVTLLLSIPAAAQLIATSLSNVLLAIREERIRFAWNFGRLVGLVLLFAVTATLEAPYVTTVAALATYLTVTYGLLLFLTLGALKRRAGRA